MAGHNKTGRSKLKYAKHVRLYGWLLYTLAYRSLSTGARAALVEFYAMFNGSNNGDLYMSYRELGKRLNVTKDTAGKYIQELGNKGFVKTRQLGSFDWKVGHATTWILTEYEFKGQPPTMDFRNWKPLREEKSVPKIRTDGPKNPDHTQKLFSVNSGNGLKN